MTDKLIAYKFNQKVGDLTRDRDDYFFCYDHDWLNQQESIPLSYSLPLKTEPFTPEESRPFFSNLLSEA